MTPLMHAARTQDRAFLRCVVRRGGAAQLQVHDVADMTAGDWAVLCGGDAEYAFDDDVERTTPGANTGARKYGVHSLHDLIAAGHTRLTQVLRRPHYYVEDPFQRAQYAPQIADDQVISCGHMPPACMRLHGPRDARLSHNLDEATVLARKLDPRLNNCSKGLTTLYSKAKAHVAGERMKYSFKQYPPVCTQCSSDKQQITHHL